MIEEGKRYNQGKIRYDLLEPHAIEELAKVFTKGAEKYEDHNWLKGMAWSKVRASLGRHLAAYDKGEDFDIDPNCDGCKTGNCVNHTGLYHMAQVAWNALCMVSYYKYFPQGDDRMTRKSTQKRVGIDIDEVLADFLGGYSTRYGTQKPAFWSFDTDFTKRYEELQNDEKFWLELKTIVKPQDLPFEPVAYITSRPPTVRKFTSDWLFKVNNYPVAPIICTEDKLSVCKELQLDYFIDDKFDTFTKLNNAGILCYLFDAPHNANKQVGFKRLNKETIKRML
jgi:5'(3')-deoxyribonucleotidase